MAIWQDLDSIVTYGDTFCQAENPDPPPIREGEGGYESATVLLLSEEVVRETEDCTCVEIYKDKSGKSGSTSPTYFISDKEQVTFHIDFFPKGKMDWKKMVEVVKALIFLYTLKHEGKDDDSDADEEGYPCTVCKEGKGYRIYRDGTKEWCDYCYGTGRTEEPLSDLDD